MDQSPISRDIKVLKEISQQFVFDLAKSDLAYYYKQSIDGIEEQRKKHDRYQRLDIVFPCLVPVWIPQS